MWFYLSVLGLVHNLSVFRFVEVLLSPFVFICSLVHESGWGTSSMEAGLQRVFISTVI